MRQKHPLREAGPLAALLLIVVGCGPGGPLKVRLRSEVARPSRGVVLFICDGCAVDLVREGCREGWLPNIRKRFVEGGTQVENAVASAPSLTYAVLTTYATGVSPARHEVVANEWFDRGLRLYRDYGLIKHYRDVNGDFWPATIYERIRPKCSLSIQSAVHRGATKNVANWAQSGVRWFFHDYTAVDKLTATTLEYAARWANQNGRWPDLLVCYFPGLDSIGHDFGAGSQRYRWSVEHLDHQIGRVCDWLEAEGLLETTYLVLVSDHGHVPVDDGGVIDLMPYLRKNLGRRVTDRPLQDGTFRQRQAYFDRFDTVYVRSGFRFATIHFRGRLGWDDMLEPDAVRAILESPPAGERLWDIPGIDVVACLAARDEVELRSPKGAARVVERVGEGGPEYRYVPVPDDIFGYLGDPALAEFVAAGFHGSRQWLRATPGQEYPDVVPHLIPLLRARRIGEVVLFAAHGYSFGPEKSGHGGIRRDEIRIPMMFAGPGIDAGGVLRGRDGRPAPARAVDLLPTLLTLLGCELPDDGSLEGMPLLPALLAQPTARDKQP